jgi:phage terminase large subunit-like protein
MSDTHPHWLFDESPIPDPLGCGERAVRFLRALKHPKTGKAFQLDRWQERTVRRTYGPRKPNGTRIVKNVVMMVPRGARKTTLGAGLGLLHTIGPERVPFGQNVLAAYDREQARIAYEEASGIVCADRRIVEATRTLDYRHSIIHRKSRAFLKAVSSDAAAQNGRTPNFVLFDEVHAWRDRKLYDVLRTGLGKTSGTLSIVISQAGRGQENLAHEIFDYARKVASGAIEDAGTLPILFETPADADWQDEDIWHRVNPGLALGYPDLDSLRQEAREAANRPALREKFKNDHLNIWLDSATDPFVDIATYDRGNGEFDLEALKGEPCWIGVDLSSRIDLSVWVAAWRREDGGYIVHARFYCPKNNLRQRQDITGAPYVQWAEEKLITPTEGDTVDFNVIEDDLRAFCDEFNAQELAFDPALAGMLMNSLADDGLPVVEMRQGALTMMPAIAALHTAIVGGKFQHGGQKVLRYCFANAEVQTNSHGHMVRLHKSKRWLSIDGAVAAAMAVRRAECGDMGRSIYDDEDARPEGLIILD